MSKQTKIAGLIGFGVSIFGFWLSGYNFSTLGTEAVEWFFISTICASFSMCIVDVDE